MPSAVRHGIVYLRAEYVYLKRYLESQLQQLRDDGLLGCSVGGPTRIRFRHPHPDGRRLLRLR